MMTYIGTFLVIFWFCFSFIRFYNNNEFELICLFSVRDQLQRLFTPQLNNISMKLPSFPLMSQRELIEPNQFCNSSTVKGCDKKFCSCTHVLQVRLNSVVEVILVDEGNFFKKRQSRRFNISQKKRKNYTRLLILSLPIV